MCGFLQRWFLRHSSAAFSVLEYIHPVSLMLAPHRHVSTHCSLIRRPPVRRGFLSNRRCSLLLLWGFGVRLPMRSIASLWRLLVAHVLLRVVRRRPRRSRASGRILLPCIHTVRKAALRCRFLVSPQWSACVRGQSSLFPFAFWFSAAEVAYCLVSGAVLVRQAALLIFGCLPPVAWAVTGFKASHETGSTNVTAFHWPVLPNPLVPRSLVGRSLTSSTHGNSTLWITNCAMRSPGWTK